MEIVSNYNLGENLSAVPTALFRAVRLFPRNKFRGYAIGRAHGTKKCP